MGQWFYAEGNRQQRGPLASDELITLYQSSRIAADTLVWRDGMAQWQPLREVADEIGLVLAPPPAADTPDPILDIDSAPADAAAVVVPPLIPEQAPPAPVAPAAVPPGAVPPVVAASVAAPRQGMSGCAIAGLVGGICALLLVAVLAILAAIALPAYQDYTLRAKAAQALAELAPIKGQVTEFVASNGRCPVNDDDGFQAATDYADGVLSAVHIGRFDNSHCGIEAALSVPGKAHLDGKLLWLDYDPDQQQWECTSEADDKYLPLECRG